MLKIEIDPIAVPVKITATTLTQKGATGPDDPPPEEPTNKLFWRLYRISDGVSLEGYVETVSNTAGEVYSAVHAFLAITSDEYNPDTGNCFTLAENDALIRLPEYQLPIDEFEFDLHGKPAIKIGLGQTPSQIELGIALHHWEGEEPTYTPPPATRVQYHWQIYSSGDGQDVGSTFDTTEDRTAQTVFNTAIQQAVGALQQLAGVPINPAQTYEYNSSDRVFYLNGNTRFGPGDPLPTDGIGFNEQSTPTVMMVYQNYVNSARFCGVRLKASSLII